MCKEGCIMIIGIYTSDSCLKPSFVSSTSLCDAGLHGTWSSQSLSYQLSTSSTCNIWPCINNYEQTGIGDGDIEDNLTADILRKLWNAGSHLYRKRSSSIQAVQIRPLWISVVFPAIQHEEMWRVSWRTLGRKIELDSANLQSIHDSEGEKESFYWSVPSFFHSFPLSDLKS